MQSVWTNTTDIPRQQMLERDLETDVAIIGGGMAGILTAYLLQERGVDAIVLEAETVACGQTKNTTAKITSQHGLIYDKLTKQFGREGAEQYARANQAAVAEYRRIITQNNIVCDFESCPSYVYSTAEKDPLEKEAEAAAALGLPASYTTAVKLPFPVAGAVRFENQAQFHPLHFLRALLGKLSIYEHTPVRSVKENSILTDKHTVHARHIIFACHYPFLIVPGYYFMRMHQERSYVIALSDVMQLDGMYISMDDVGYSFRNYKDLLLLGGGNHRTGENSAGGKYEELRNAANKFFPGCKETAYWSAQDCMPHDGVPYIGQYSNSTPNWYVATGFQKWGMSSSMVAATLLSDAICGIDNPNAGVFSPQRYVPAASIPEFLKDGAQAVKGLFRENLSIPQATIDELPCGHGGVVEAEDGEKVGVYKDEEGSVHMVDTKCPHLGCQLAWNPDEKSWDCPCHGSRFDYTGKWLNGPAQKDIVLA